jgi:serine/threonine protein kinase
LSGTRYELVEPIGQGGMGTVYHSRDRTLDRPVAIKVLHALPEGLEGEARLVREARLTARLEHPGIVPVHDAGMLPDGRFFYVMKLVRGQRLDDPAALPVGLVERLRLFRQICDAVAFAHAQGVLHRDLKPQNVMLGPFGEVLVMDWGVAKEVGRPEPAAATKESSGGLPLPPHTNPGTVLGTPGYMAPEQAKGKLERIDARTDVFALGGILYFLLTGLGPRCGAFGDVTPPRRCDRSIPRPLEAVCLKALAADPAQRYADVPALADDVANFLAGARVRAYPEGILQTTRRLAANYRAAIALVLAYLVMRLLLLIFAGA